MSAARFAAGIIIVATAAVTACSDGGPPGSWGRPRSHPASATAADGGTREPSSAPDAAADGDGDETTRADTTEAADRADNEGAAASAAADADAGEDPPSEGRGARDR